MRKLLVMLSVVIISLNAQANKNSEKVDINNEKTESSKKEIQVRVLPNPVVEIGELEFTLEEDAKEVFIFIANAAGKIVSPLPIGATPAGVNKVILNVDGLQGFYVVGIQAGNQSGTCKMYVK